MDGFDDLLSSSRHPFDDNPFANPFDKPRSSSPDPWSTFRHQEQEHEAYSGGFQELQTSAVEPERDDAGHEPQSPVKAQGHEDEGPLHIHDSSETQSAKDVTEETESDVGHGDLRSPGFRESTDDHETSEEEHSSPPSLGKAAADATPHATVDAPLHSSSTPRPSTPPSTEQEETPSYSTPTPASTNKFVSPLETPGPGVVAAFASLALGGESTGGWQDTPTEYTVPTAQKSEDVRQDESVDSTPEAVEEDQPTHKEAPGIQPLFSVTVEDPQKVGDPIRPYILYTVHTKTNSPLFSKPSFSVLRRYSDFLWLYETLYLNNPGVIVPPVPEKNPFGRFDNLFVQQRRLALEICIQKIASHPVLIKDPDFKLFLESDTFALDIKHRKIEMAQDRGGILSSIGQTLTGSKFLEVDDWFDKKKTYLDGLESQLKGLVKAIDSVSKQREELSISTGEFSLSITDLSESDLGKELCHSLAALGTVEKKAQDLQHTQAQEDTITLMTTVEEYSRIINSVRMSFASRVRCHSQWQTTEGELRRVKQSYERARSQGRIPQERMGLSLAQIAEAERRAVDAKHDFERCSKLVKTEFARFEQERIGDFKKALESFLEGMIQRQLGLVKAWESYQELLLKKVNIDPAAPIVEENAVADNVRAS